MTCLVKSLNYTIRISEKIEKPFLIKKKKKKRKKKTTTETMYRTTHPSKRY